jgi:hypothetical protein
MQWLLLDSKNILLFCLELIGESFLIQMLPVMSPYLQQRPIRNIDRSVLYQHSVEVQFWLAKVRVTYSLSSGPNQGAFPAAAFSVIRSGFDVAGIAT